jgi:hypothetical protein
LSAGRCHAPRQACFCGQCAGGIELVRDVLSILKDNDVRLITYVPDNVLTPLINGVIADNYFMAVGAPRARMSTGRSGRRSVISHE